MAVALLKPTCLGHWSKKWQIDQYDFQCFCGYHEQQNLLLLPLAWEPDKILQISATEKYHSFVWLSQTVRMDVPWNNCILFVIDDVLFSTAKVQIYFGLSKFFGEKECLSIRYGFGIPSGKSERTYRMERSDRKGMEGTQRTTAEHWTTKRGAKRQFRGRHFVPTV